MSEPCKRLQLQSSRDRNFELIGLTYSRSKTGKTDITSMKSAAELNELIAAWWKKDGVRARISNTYVRHGESRVQGAEAALDDYDSGVRDTLARLEENRTVVESVLLRRYEKAHHGERIDVASYRLGVQRALLESGFASNSQ